MDANTVSAVADADNFDLGMKWFDSYLSNEEIRDRFVIGILDKVLLLELQLKADLTLENCIDRVRNSEMVKKQNEVVKGVDHVSCGGR